MSNFNEDVLTILTDYRIFLIVVIPTDGRTIAATYTLKG